METNVHSLKKIRENQPKLSNEFDFKLWSIDLHVLFLHVSMSVCLLNICYGLAELEIADPTRPEFTPKSPHPKPDFYNG